MMSPHRIRRQAWRIRAPDRETAFALRTWFRQEQETLLQPVLERTFDALKSGDEEIHLNRLTIELRIDPDEDWGSALPEQLSSAVARAMQEALATRETSAESGDPRQTGAEARLVHYLQTGTLMWFDTPTAEPTVSERLVRAARVWSADPQRNWPRLVMATPADARRMLPTLLRFLGLSEDAAKTQWTSLAVGKIRAAGTITDAQALENLLRSTAAQAHRTALQALALLWAVSSESALAVRTVIRQEGLAELGQHLPALASDAGWAALNASVAAPPADAPRPHPGLSLQSKRESEESERSAGIIADGDRQAQFHKDIVPLTLSADTGPGLAAGSAGLVLLHPYLIRLFAGLGWTAGNHRRDQPFPAEHLGRAAALLHWLATGADHAREYELVFIKLLLGCSSADAVMMDEKGLPQQLREEGEALLSAAISHWPALGRISIDGLRSAFLQRRGLLYPVADGWLLRPYPETYDVLLNRLPWGISLVRLPWMRSTLYTEWIAP